MENTSTVTEEEKLEASRLGMKKEDRNRKGSQEETDADSPLLVVDDNEDCIFMGIVWNYSIMSKTG